MRQNLPNTDPISLCRTLLETALLGSFKVGHSFGAISIEGGRFGERQFWSVFII